MLEVSTALERDLVTCLSGLHIYLKLLGNGTQCLSRGRIGKVMFEISVFSFQVWFLIRNDFLSGSADICL